MTVYFIVLVAIFCLTTMEYSTEIRIRNERLIPKRSIAVLMILLLVLVAGLRYQVGTDYYNYYAAYPDFKEAELSLLDEPGLKIIARISAHIYDDPATMMFLAAAITVILMAGTLIKNSDLYWLSIFLYIFLGLWHGCFNGVRQYLAAAILFAGHKYIKQNQLLKWLAVVFCASLFHVTAIIGIVFYFYAKIKICIKNFCFSVICVFIGITLYDKIFNMIAFLKNDTFDFEGVGSGYLTNGINPLRILVAWVPVLFFWLFKRYYNVQEPRFKFYVNMSILHAILMTTAINSTYLGRVGIYTGLYNAITWPILLKQVELRSRKGMILFMLLMYMLYWTYEISGPTLRNFQWIFQR